MNKSICFSVLVSVENQGKVMYKSRVTHSKIIHSHTSIMVLTEWQVVFMEINVKLDEAHSKQTAMPNLADPSYYRYF